jgi:hypothetical protein
VIFKESGVVGFGQVVGHGVSGWLRGVKALL